MSDTRTDQEIMDEFYATHYPKGAGTQWRDVVVLDDDDDDEEALDLDTVIEEFIDRIAVAAAKDQGILGMPHGVLNLH